MRLSGRNWVGGALVVVLGLWTSLSDAQDILPLRRGYYVSADVPCSRASNATLNLFDGEKLGAAHTQIRKTTVRRAQDGSFAVTEEWVDLQGGERTKPQVRKFNLRVLGSTEFIIKGSPRDYQARYCPQSELPDPWCCIDLRDQGID
jgi:hypothetical protein